MILKNLQTVERVKMQMAGADRVQMQVLAGPEDGCERFAMRRFIVEPGGYTPKHSHDFEHEILVLAGEGVAFGNGREQPIKAGDVVIVPANEVHQFRAEAASGKGLEILCMVPAFVHKPGAPMPVMVDCGADAVGKK